MSFKSKLIVTASIAMLSFASPISAQSFNRSDGTGNELPSYYDKDGGLPLASYRRSRTKSRRTEVGCTRSRAFIMQLLAFAAMNPGTNIHDRSENIDRVAAAIERAVHRIIGALAAARSFS